MGEFRGLSCDGCGDSLSFVIDRKNKIVPTKAIIEQQARNRGWQAPCKDGRHLCGRCRRQDGVDGAAKARTRNRLRRQAERARRG